MAAFGLDAKEPENVDGGRPLGLAVKRNRGGRLVFERGNVVPKLSGEPLTRRKLFSVCGQLTGHYPICGWLRTACSYIKRVSDGVKWEDSIGPTARDMLNEVLEKVLKDDPVRGPWAIPQAKSGRVWTDASSIALGAVVEVGGVTAEDGAWLRKADDVAHINVAELDAALKGINMALKWDLTDIEVVTDSATVEKWLRSAIEGDCRVKVAGMSEVLVRRRLSIISDLAKECGTRFSVILVASGENRADALTRVSKAWLVKKKAVNVSCAADVRTLHSAHHFGVDRTLDLAKKSGPDSDTCSGGRGGSGLRPMRIHRSCPGKA